MHRPRKRFGQHFLNDRRILGRMADALDPRPGETVIEIGPGQGSLTAVLEPRAHRLVLVELDRDLARDLRARYHAHERVHVVQADVLEAPLVELSGGGPWCVTGNIPYYITTPIIFHALAAPRPRAIVLLIQEEVGERLAAAAGSAEYGALSVTAQALATITRHGRVPRGAFAPPPRVDSIIVALTPREQPLVQPAEEGPFKTLVQGAFSLRRKQMLRVLRTFFDVDAATAADLLQRCGIARDVRPETLTPEEYVALLRAAAAVGLVAGPRC